MVESPGVETQGRRTMSAILSSSGVLGHPKDRAIHTGWSRGGENGTLEYEKAKQLKYVLV